MWRLVALAVFPLLTAEIPPLSGRVVDRAGLLTPQERGSLERKLEALERESSFQIVIASIASLEGEPLEDFSLRLAEAWRIGQKGLDNGAIVLVVRDERRIRIEVGYGLEPVIPDGLAGRIIRERIQPEFRRGDFYGGLAAAVDALALAARQEYPAGKSAPESGSDSESGFLTVGLFLFFILGIVGNAIGWWASALPASLALPVLVAYASAISLPLLLIFVPLGFLLGLLAMAIVRSSGGRVGRSWSSGARWGGGGLSIGRGFSGGGGRFGGGGASGRW